MLNEGQILKNCRTQKQKESYGMICGYGMICFQGGNQHCHLYYQNETLKILNSFAGSS